VENGTIPRERIEESYRRIMNLKKRLTMSTADYYRDNLSEARKEAAQLLGENEKNQQYILELESQLNNTPTKKSGKKKKN
jgi:hypothetical protein